jgi:hypothetical protein
MNRRIFALAIVALAGSAASCATDSYHAYEAGEGYSEERLSATSWRVSFVGATIESQSAVEEQLLRRSAELTVQNGYEWFTPSTGAGEAEEAVVVTGVRAPAAVVDGADVVWRPHWRRRSASRWTDWDPQGSAARTAVAPSPAPQASNEVRLSASAEVTMGRGPAPAGAVDARAVLARAQAAQ